MDDYDFINEDQPDKVAKRTETDNRGFLGRAYNRLTGVF